MTITDRQVLALTVNFAERRKSRIHAGPRVHEIPFLRIEMIL